MKYQKDDIITIVISDMGTDGEGIGKIDGFTFFVKDDVIGDVPIIVSAAAVKYRHWTININCYLKRTRSKIT